VPRTLGGSGDLWIVGGGNLASQFADAGLLDEVAVTIVPVVLGAGNPLFDRRLPGGAMQLTGVSPGRTGWSSCATQSGTDRRRA
jgi:dihydrofolate reductase